MKVWFPSGAGTAAAFHWYWYATPGVDVHVVSECCNKANASAAAGVPQFPQVGEFAALVKSKGVVPSMAGQYTRKLEKPVVGV